MKGKTMRKKLTTKNKRIIHEISNLKPDTDERRLNLEQLRWLKNDFQIRIVLSDSDSHSIDRIEDLDKSSLFLSKLGL